MLKKDLIPITKAIPDPDRLFDYIADRANGIHSEAHGPGHWRRVAAAGQVLLTEYTDVDPVVVFLFAMFHDSMRMNDFTDPDHGRRGAGLLEEVFYSGNTVDPGLSKIITEDHAVLKCSLAQYITASIACDNHTEAEPIPGIDIVPELAVCFDSDRLNLWRVGITPNPAFLFTEKARKPEMIEWGAELCWTQEPPSWADLYASYAALSLNTR